MPAADQEASSVLAPVQSLLDTLPLMEITEEAFESFSTDLTALLPDFARVRRHGRRGDKQDGIDAAADRADKHVGLQYRRVKNLGPKAFARTVEEATYDADEFVLVLGSRASAHLRNSVRQTANWEVWDSDDIARLVRQLPEPDARRLLETRFGPEVRKAFLGQVGPAVFHSVEDHFAPMMREGLVFDHRLELVGRDDLLTEFNGFLADPVLSVAVLTGRGGMGKSRLLKAMGETAGPTGWTVLFADEHGPFDENTLDEIPLGPALLVVDDGHRRPDLGRLLDHLARRVHPTKLVIGARPEGRPTLLALFKESPVDGRTVHWLTQMRELSRAEGEQLANAALGEGLAHLARAVFALTRDCPLVTVVASRLLRERQIPPGLLAEDQEFRDQVLVGFRDASLGRVSDRVAQDLARKTLELVSALQPVEPDSADLRQRAADYLAVRPSEFTRALDALEQAGVLVRRGVTLRVVPDVLADYLLGDACLTRAGALTGFAEEMFDHFRDIHFDRLLANLAEVDWRVRGSTGVPTSLLDSTWRHFRDSFEQASNVQRQYLLGILGRVAQYQPGRMLDLAEWTMANPAPDGAAADIRVDRHEAVLGMLAKLIEGCAYGDNLERACELLWTLGREDHRETNRFPDHPIRVLSRIAEYSPTTSLDISERVFDLARNWLRDPMVHTYVYSPLDTIETLLAKEGLDPVSDGLKITFGQLHINPDVTGALRSRVIRRGLDLVVAAHPRVALRALRLLESGLGDPVGYFGRVVSDAEKQVWEVEQREILSGLTEALRQVREPILQLRISDAARWSAANGQTPAVREGAAAVRAAVPEGFELNLTRALTTPWFWADDMSTPWDAERAEAARIKRLDDVARQMRTLWPDAGEFAQNVSRRLQAVITAGESTDPGYVLAIASREHADLAAGLARFVLDHPGDPLEAALGPVLRELRLEDETRALDLAEEAFASRRDLVRRHVAWLYGPAPWTSDLSERDRQLLQAILSSGMPLAGGAVEGGVRILARDDVTEAKAAVLAIDPGPDGNQATALAAMLAPDGDLYAGLTDEELDRIVMKFSKASTIDEYDTQVFLAAATRRRSSTVARMLLARVDDAFAHAAEPNYHALPFEVPGVEWWSDLDTGSRVDVLTELREAMLPGSRERVLILPELFGWIAGDWSAEARGVVLEWLRSGEELKVVASARLLQGLPRELLFEETHFIDDVLSAAESTSKLASDSAATALHTASYNSSRHRRVTIAGAQDIWVRDRSAQAANQLPRGSRTRLFYEELARWAEEMIKRMRLIDEEMLDGAGA